ncbi:gluconokinase [Loigolactobacillus jiayinensis]|uniref:Gluconokinase n=1 Tax=Loigolactobacillus jiayinensis TaxID=2486016 RepID=A0ABW1RE44_9LACO|nr:gluconokinase [Loigolactobacillus jiayinensis]
MDFMIGVDIGTTSTKVVLFDLKGQMQAVSRQLYPLYHDQPDFAEEDPNEIFTAVVTGLIEVIQKQQLLPADIKGIAFSSAMHSVILMDQADQPLTRVLTCADNRAEKEAEQLKTATQANALFTRTGVPIHPMSPLTKLMWFKQNQPQLLAQAKQIIGIKEYVLWRLFGRYVEDYSIANATGLFNLNTLDWDEPALALAGIKRAQLPQLVDTDYQLKGMNPAIATKIGLAMDTPVIIGASDGTLSNLGLNAIQPGAVAVTIGTSGAVRMVAPTPQVDPAGRLFTYYLDRTHWVIGGPVNNGGVVFQWVRDQLFPAEQAQAQRDGTDLYEKLTQLAAAIPAGSNGLLCQPYFGGERAPLWNAAARGSYFGLTQSHTRAHIVRATLEGIVYNLNAVLQLLQALTDMPLTIQASGGFAHSQLWCQILADVFGQPINIPASIESSALGAVIVGMKSLGYIDSLDEVKTLVTTTRQVQPLAANVAVYQKIMPLWAEVTEKLTAEYAKIAALQQELSRK